MADRVISYRFEAKFDSFRANLAAGGKSVDAFGNKLTALDRQGAQMRRGLTSVGDSAGRVGLAASVGIGALVVASTNFEKAMSKVDAATHETAGNMELLRAAALKAGADTAFSATEAAGAIEELAKAGVSTEDILGGALTGALDLAAAGTLEVSQAAEIAATTLTQFGLDGSQATRVADVLAASAGKAQGEVTDMAGALKYVGPVAAQMGLSVEDAGGAIAFLASQGILGEQAGTSLRGMLTSLTSPSKVAREEMDALGISMYDAQGEFIGLDGLAGQLKSTMGGLTNAERDEALGRIFGNEQITAARILYAGGAEAVRKWTGEVDESGYAAETAARKMDNLAGDLEYLKGSLETAAIGAGEGSQGPLRVLVQGLDDTVNAFNELPGPMKTATVAGLALTAVFGGGTWFTARTISGLTTTREALVDLGVSTENASKATRVLGRSFAAAGGIGAFALGVQNTNEALGTLEATAGGAAAGFAVGGPWGAAVGGAIGLVVSLGTSHDDTTAKVKELTSTFDAQTGAITENTRVKINAQAQEAGLLDAAESLGLQTSLVTDAILGNAAAQEQLNAATEGYKADYTITSVENLRKSYSDQEVQAILSARAATLLRDEIPALGADFKSAAADAEQFARGMEQTSTASGQAGTSAYQSAEDLKVQAEALKKSRDAAADTATALFNVGDSVNDAKTSLGGWIRDLNAQADALRNFRRNAVEAGEKGVRQGLINALREAGPEGARRMRQLANASEDEISRANRAWGRGQREVRKYTDTVGGVPKAKATNLTVNGAAQSTEEVRRLNSELQRLRSREIYVTTIRRQVGPAYKANERASGGPVYGPGTKTSDSIPAWLSNGEFVMKASAVEHYGLSTMHDMNAMRLAEGGSPSGKGSGKRRDSMFAFDVSDLRKTLRSWTRELALSEKALASETKARDEAIQQRDSVRSSVASGLRQDLWAKPDNPWTAGAGMNPTATANSVAATANEFTKLVKALRAKGLDGPALAEAAASGDIERLRFLNSLAPKDLNAYETAINAQESALRAAGVATSGALGLDAAAAQLSAQVKASQQMVKEQQKATKTLKAAIDAVPAGVGREVNGAGSRGKRNQRRDGRS